MASNYPELITHPLNMKGDLKNPLCSVKWRHPLNARNQIGSMLYSGALHIRESRTNCISEYCNRIRDPRLSPKFLAGISLSQLDPYDGTAYGDQTGVWLRSFEIKPEGYATAWTMRALFPEAILPYLNGCEQERSTY